MENFNYEIFNRENKIIAFLKKTILYFVIALFFTFMVSLLLGYEYSIVKTASMEPTLHANRTMVVIAPVDMKDIKVGDIVTKDMVDPAPSVTHRVVRILENGNLKTLGDAERGGNKTEDAWEVTPENYMGKVVAKSHFLGGVVQYLKIHLWESVIAIVIYFLAYLAIN